MKKFLTIILYIIFNCLLLSTNVQAKEMGLDQYLAEYSAREIKTVYNWQDAVAYTYNEMLNYNGVVILYKGSHYNQLTIESVKELLLSAMQIDDPHNLSDGAVLWGNMSKYNKGFALTDEGALICLKIEYKHSKEEMNMLNKELVNIMYQLESTQHISSFSDEGKIKAIHNYICNRFDYDKTFSNYTPYAGMTNLINGKEVMVCQGYSLLAYSLLNMCNIETKILISETHSWNVVKLYDEWYNLDITNDDLGIYNQPITYKYYLKAHLKGVSYNQMNTTYFYRNLSINFAEEDYQKTIDLGVEWNILMYKLKYYIPYTIVVMILLILYSIVSKILEHWYIKKKKKSRQIFELYNSV